MNSTQSNPRWQMNSNEGIFFAFISPDLDLDDEPDVLSVKVQSSACNNKVRCSTAMILDKGKLKCEPAYHPTGYKCESEGSSFCMYLSKLLHVIVIVVACIFQSCYVYLSKFFHVFFKVLHVFFKVVTC